MEALKPCPFCGARLERSEVFSHRSRDCFVHPPLEDTYCPAYDVRLYTNDDRIGAWNRRTPPPPEAPASDWVVVPRTATFDMISAMGAYIWPDLATSERHDLLIGAWAAALSAAPQAPPPGGGTEALNLLPIVEPAVWEVGSEDGKSPAVVSFTVSLDEARRWAVFFASLPELPPEFGRAALNPAPKPGGDQP